MANPSIQAVTATFGQLLVSTRLATTFAATVYTVPASNTVSLAQGSICNTSDSPVNVSMALLKVGDTDDGTHTVISLYQLNARETLLLEGFIKGHKLGAGEAISMTVSTAVVITVVISGAVSS